MTRKLKISLIILSVPVFLYSYNNFFLKNDEENATIPSKCTNSQFNCNIKSGTWQIGVKNGYPLMSFFSEFDNNELNISCVLGGIVFSLPNVSRIRDREHIGINSNNYSNVIYTVENSEENFALEALAPYDHNLINDMKNSGFNYVFSGEEAQRFPSDRNFDMFFSACSSRFNRSL